MIKNLLCSQPVLEIYDQDLPINIYTDASLEGKQNLEADCLSRNPVLESNENTDEQLKVVNLIKLEDIIKDQKNYEEIQNKKSKLIERCNVFFKM
ncbi:jg26676, partial [Pararge aegeria aegeria]